MPDRDESAALSRALFFGTMALTAYLAYRIVAPFLSEIGWAVVMAIAISPLRERLHPRLGSTRTALVLTVLVIVVLVIPFVFAASVLFEQGTQAVAGVEAQLQEKGGAGAWLDAAWSWLRDRITFLPTTKEVVARVTAGLGDAASFLAGRAGDLLKRVVSFLFSLGITLAVLFFLLRDAETFANALRRLLPFGEEQNRRLLRLINDLVAASVTSTLAIAAIQGVLGGLAFALLGISSPAVWGIVMSIMALLPIVGATIIWVPAAVWLFLSGSLVKAIILALVGVLVLGNVDNVVRPWLMAGTARLNTLVLLVSLLGGVTAFGFIGIVLGPVVAALFTALVGSYLLSPSPTEEVAAGEPAAQAPSQGDA
jgi:predicted PurR-regulated permease PerM